jgi:glucose-6-phosphate 1-epimerase
LLFLHQNDTEKSGAKLDLMDLQSLNDNFALPGTLTFDEPHPGMIRAVVSTPACSAELYLHGAHLTQWQPTGEQPVLFLSERSAYSADKAIRGGIPIIFPWFGSPATSPAHPPANAPSHGFARTSPWNLAFAALAGEDLHLTLALEPNEASRAVGYETFQLAYQIILGRKLTLRLTVANTASGDDAQPFLFEEALHTYLSVGDVQQVSLTGLQGTTFLDKTDNFLRKQQAEPTLTLSGETDRPYLDTAAAVVLHDAVLHRRITIRKSNSQTTVI